MSTNGERDPSSEIEDDRIGWDGLDAESRKHVAACTSALPDRPGEYRVIFGFDGYIDTGRELIDHRTGTDVVPIESLRRLGDRLVESAAAESSLSIEWRTTYTRTGGHTAHVGRAYDRLDMDVTIVGTYGQPVLSEYESEFDEQTIVSIDEPGSTDAIEFADQKLMLTDSEAQRQLDWDTIVESVGIDRLVSLVDGRDLFGVGYWAMSPSMPDIWDGLRTSVWPRLEDPPKFVLIDPFDVRQLSLDELRSGVPSLAAFDETVPVTMSANKAETYRLAELFVDDPERLSFTDAAAAVKDGCDVTSYAGHAIDHCVYVTDDERVSLRSPYTNSPVLTTSAGDHFAAGLALGTLEGLSPGATLVVASAVAGSFVRTGEPPTYDEIRAFVSTYESYFE